MGREQLDMEDIKGRVGRLGSKVGSVDTTDTIFVAGLFIVLVLTLLACKGWREVIIPATLIIAGVVLGWTVGSCKAKNDLLAPLIAKAMKDVAKIVEWRSGDARIYRLRCEDGRIEFTGDAEFSRAMRLLRARHLGPNFCRMRVQSFREIVERDGWVYNVSFVAVNPSLETIATEHETMGSLRRALTMKFLYKVRDHNPENFVGALELAPKNPPDINLGYGFTAHTSNTTRIEGGMQNG